MQTSAYSRVRVDGGAVDIEVVLCEHFGPLVDGPARSIEDAPQHVLGHTELQTVAGEFDFRLRQSDKSRVAASAQVPF